MWCCAFMYVSGMVIWHGNLYVVTHTHMQAAAFCQFFDLEVTSSEVIFDRLKTSDISAEERTLPVLQSHHLVLSKKTGSLGEVQWRPYHS